MPAKQRRAVLIGDSITRAWGVFAPDFFGANGYIDRGISGQTTSQILVRFRQDVISLEPQAVHLMAGTNDIAENAGPYHPRDTTNNLMSTAELAKLHGVRVILASVPPTTDFPWRTGLQPVSKIRALNDWIRA
ncbi:MAG: GDSL family lipase, partial [Alphaproteobacteria bacterium]|nr:GDSL family lipase [Alphaproteobacteria bacterium]